MHKNFLNNFIFCKVQKTIFWSRKIVNTTLSKVKIDQMLTENLKFPSHLWTFTAKNKPKSSLLGRKIMLKHSLNNFWKSLEKHFIAPKIFKMTHSKFKSGSTFQKKSRFYRSFINLKGWLYYQKLPFKIKNNALGKSSENDFFDLKNCQITVVNLAKSVEFWVLLRSTSFKLPR